MKRKEKDTTKEVKTGNTQPSTSAVENRVNPEKEVESSEANNTSQTAEAVQTAEALQTAETEQTAEAKQTAETEQTAEAEQTVETEQAEKAEQTEEAEPDGDKGNWYAESLADLVDEDRQAVDKWLDNLITQVNDHALSKESIQTILHALHYDRDVAQAGIDGEVRGRNTRIEEMFEQQRKAKEIHVLGGAAPQPSPILPANILGGLSAADRQTIWERGNEKRVILR